jgi:hypothetical protein
MRKRTIKIRVNERLTVTVGRKVAIDMPLEDLQHPHIRQDVLNQILSLIYEAYKP